MKITKSLENNNILILGFGREGKSTYAFIRKHFPNKKISIADKNPSAFEDILTDTNLNLISGEQYLQSINDDYFIIKSPGISLKDIKIPSGTTLSSQTDLFIQQYHSQIIGITGTKGKSTTANLIYHILQKSEKKSLIAGNMGIPLFDIIDKIDSETTIVCEFSSHQLEFIKASPHIAVLLNIFQEHLDHYKDYASYQLAKLNIAKHQKNADFFIYPKHFHIIENCIRQQPIASNIENYSNNEICEMEIKEEVFYFKGKAIGKYQEDFPLKGMHNMMNVAAAILACKHIIKDVTQIFEAVRSFQPLPHRMEYIGNFCGIDFYNDSIATIPEASLQALNALKKTGTLILGGHDRGIDYTSFMQELSKIHIENLIFTGEAGKRMMEIHQEMKIESNSTFFFSNEYREIVDLAYKHTPQGKICLLSPAASSYDQFKNFEHRGNIFKELVKNQTHNI